MTIPINKNEPHEVSEVICVKCGKRWISVRQAAQAVDTTHITDSATMLTKEGFEVRHEVFLHDAPAPTPEEPAE